MPVLTAPSPRRTFPFRPRPPARPAVPALELPTVSFFGRSLAEYTRCFDLNVDALRGSDVLDVAAGPSSFTAEACARRLDAVAVDPGYGAPASELATRIEADYARMFAQVRAHRALFQVSTPAQGDAPSSYFDSFEAAEAERRQAAQRFLSDYEAHYPHGRYVAAALPRLPFFDRTFDLVLCGHLLFLHAAQFDLDWHLAACRELVRVSDDEVRIHPLCGPDGRPYAKLPTLRRELRNAGIESRVVAVNYAFFVGASSMLVLRRASS